MRLPDLSEHTPPEEPVEVDRRILPRSAKLLTLCVVVAVGAEFWKSRLTNIENPDVRILRGVLTALSAGAVGYGVLFLIFTLASAASIKSHALQQRGVRRATIRNAIIVALVLFLAAVFLFLPFCAGSFDCTPLGTRMLHALSGK